LKVVEYFPISRYVLKDGLLPASPNLEPESADSANPFAIYGFSDKPQYDAFHSQCSRLLTPYPLVKRFLQNQIDQSAARLGLVVLDAASPSQAELFAIEMKGLVEALDRNQSFVFATHRMLLTLATSTYRVMPILAPAEGGITR
jgi:hypothetical protein